MASRLLHLELDDSTVLCGRERTGLDVLVSVPGKLPRKKFCKACYDTFAAKAPGPRRTFEVVMRVTLEVQDSLIQVGLSDEFAEYITRMSTPENVVAHLAYNMVKHNFEVNQIDGYADRLRLEARVLSVDVEFDDVVETT